MSKMEECILEKSSSKNNEIELKKDCVFYQKNRCYALTEFVCENKNCTFYRLKIICNNQLILKK